MNDPVPGWYSRAPRSVRPVAVSFAPPTKPFSPSGQAGWAVPLICPELSGQRICG
jgi:hypothetical protein